MLNFRKRDELSPVAGQQNRASLPKKAVNRMLTYAQTPK